jgi:tRNA (guanine37-N1)-methyltransferase
LKTVWKFCFFGKFTVKAWCNRAEINIVSGKLTGWDMAFHATILTLYPDMFPGPLGQSLSGRALDKGLWQLQTSQVRDFATDKHRSVDDTPAGGGAGMVLRADILAKAIDAAAPEDDPRPRLLMSPRGRPFTQAHAHELAEGPGAIIVCGRFEGVDQRVIDSRKLEEVSIGDYILSGGEIGAITMLDAIVRLIPGVMGNMESAEAESFETGLLEHPHYTRPSEFEGQMIPEVLTSGNHKKIHEWRMSEAERITRENRPDLWDAYMADEDDVD